MEPSPDILNVLSGLGVGGILAVMFYYQNNKNVKDYADRITEQTKLFSDKIESLLEIERGRTEMLVTLVKDNIAQTTSNTEVVRALHRRLDNEQKKEIVGPK